MPPFVSPAPEWVSGNRLALLEAGREFFPALRAAFDAATREIHLETYIFAADATGAGVVDALCQAAARGVAVRLLVDGFGSPGFQAAFGKRLEAAGVRFLVLRRIHPLWSVHRLHRKLAVVDGETAFVGGINIVDDAKAPGDGLPFRWDFAVRVEGPLAAHISYETARLWNRACRTNFRGAWRIPAQNPEKAPPQAPAAPPREGGTAALLVRSPVRHPRGIERAYLAAIADAKEEILLAHAYFLPGRRLRRALVEAAKRGVRVTVLMPGVPDVFLAHHASEAVRGAFLRAGVRLFSYRRAELHAKVAVVDGHWLTVGSSNLDPLSLRFAHEANLAAEDPALAADLGLRLKRALRDEADEITLADWQRRPWPVRALRWLAYALVRATFRLMGDDGQR